MTILHYFENGIQLLACCISIVSGIILLMRKISTVRYKILRSFENVQLFHKGGFPIGLLNYIVDNGLQITIDSFCCLWKEYQWYRQYCGNIESI